MYKISAFNVPLYLPSNSHEYYTSRSKSILEILSRKKNPTDEKPIRVFPKQEQTS